ncbi:MAG: hypothetical protein AB7W59_16240 [Acidimicrobiia bacterium]
MAIELPAAVQQELTRLLDDWTGALLSRSRVIDDLLDLRAAVAAHPAAQARVDRALGDLPGQNLVAREWAAEVVADVAATFGTVQVG